MQTDYTNLKKDFQNLKMEWDKFMNFKAYNTIPCLSFDENVDEGILDG